MPSEFSTIMGTCPYRVVLKQNRHGTFYWVIKAPGSTSVIATSGIIKREDRARAQSQTVARWMGAKWIDDTDHGRKFPGRRRVQFDRAPDVDTEDAA